MRREDFALPICNTVGKQTHACSTENRQLFRFNSKHLSLNNTRLCQDAMLCMPYPADLEQSKHETWDCTQSHDGDSEMHAIPWNPIEEAKYISQSKASSTYDAKYEDGEIWKALSYSPESLSKLCYNADALNIPSWINVQDALIKKFGSVPSMFLSYSRSFLTLGEICMRSVILSPKSFSLCWNISKTFSISQVLLC